MSVTVEPVSQGVVEDCAGARFELKSRSCPTCDVVATRLVGLRGGEHQRYRQGVVTRIVSCQQCGLLFPDPFPYPLDPQKLYGDPDRYFGGRSESEKLEGDRSIVREVATRFGRKPFSLLDVGSGCGELLAAAKQEGVHAVGLELSEAMIAAARERFGVEVACQTIEEFAATEDECFDAVTLCAVLEHMHDPDAAIAAIAKLTRPGSVLYINVPREPNLLTMVGNAWNRLRGSRAVYNLQPTWPPYHVYGFNPRALRKLLEKHDFRIESLEVHAAPKVPFREGSVDRARAFVATQINRVANYTGTASNMNVWARRNG